MLKEQEIKRAQLLLVAVGRSKTKKGKQRLLGIFSKRLKSLSPEEQDKLFHALLRFVLE